MSGKWSRFLGGIYRLQPVDRMAARVTGFKPKKTQKKKKLDPEELWTKAALTKDSVERDALLRQAAASEKTKTKRLIGEKAIKRARRQLEAAKWRRENPRK